MSLKYCMKRSIRCSHKKFVFVRARGIGQVLARRRRSSLRSALLAHPVLLNGTQCSLSISPSASHSFTVFTHVRARGIEPLSTAWKAVILPLNYARLRKAPAGRPACSTYEYCTRIKVIHAKFRHSAESCVKKTYGQAEYLMKTILAHP